MHKVSFENLCRLHLDKNTARSVCVRAAAKSPIAPVGKCRPRLLEKGEVIKLEAIGKGWRAFRRPVKATYSLSLPYIYIISQTFQFVNTFFKIFFALFCEECHCNQV